MTMMKTSLKTKLPLSVACLGLICMLQACQDDDATKPTPAADMAQSAQDMGSQQQDMSTADMSAEDMTKTPDMNVPDADMGAMADMPEDRDMAADPACMYLDLDVLYYQCGDQGDYSLLRKFEDVDLGEARCPVYYTLKGTRYETAAQALQDKQCATSCAYKASMSVTFLHCEQRNGYIQWTAGDDAACPPIFEFAEGVYPSVERWKMANPCPG